MKKFNLFILALGMVLYAPFIAAQTKIPELKQRVNDFTNTLSFQEWQMLDELLKSYEDTTSTQVAVLMINSLDGESIEEYAAETSELNKIGEGNKNGGVLLVIVKKDLKVKIHAVPGLEDVLTEDVSSQIIKKEIFPYIKSDNYFGGIATGSDAIIRVILHDYQLEGKGKWAPFYTVILIILAILFVIFIIFPMLSARRRSVISATIHRYFSGWGYTGKGKSKDDGTLGGGGASGSL
jgi:uncharacterized protein